MNQIDKRKLKARIIREYGNYANFCRAKSVNERWLSRLLNEREGSDRSAPNLRGAAVLCKALDLTKDEYFEIFVDPYHRTEK